MNLAPIGDIKYELKKMYPAFKFEMKANHVTNSYMITAYKDGQNMSTITIEAETPMTDFWIRVKAWMRPLITYTGRRQ